MRYVTVTPTEFSFGEAVLSAIPRMSADQKAALLAVALEVEVPEIRAELFVTGAAMNLLVPPDYVAASQAVLQERCDLLNAQEAAEEQKSRRGAAIAAGHERRRQAKAGTATAVSVEENPGTTSHVMPESETPVLSALAAALTRSGPAGFRLPPSPRATPQSPHLPASGSSESNGGSNGQ